MINDTPSPIAYICRLRLFKMGFFSIIFQKFDMKNVVYITLEEYLSKKLQLIGEGGILSSWKHLWSEDVVLSNLCGPSTRIFRGAIPPVNKTYKCWNNRYKNLRLLSPFPNTQNPIGRTLLLRKMLSRSLPFHNN